MNSIPLSTHGGIVVRRAALDEKQIRESTLLEAMEVVLPGSASDQLLSFGPSFGEEAMNEFVRRLKTLGP